MKTWPRFVAFLLTFALLAIPFSTVTLSGERPSLGFMAGGFWPVDWERYQRDPERYFELYPRDSGSYQAVIRPAVEDGTIPQLV